MDQYISLRNLRFLLHEVFGTEDITAYERYQDYDQEAIDFVLDAAKQIGDTHLFPIYREMDKGEGKVRFEDGVVKVHPKLKEAIDAIGEGGFIAARNDYEDEGQQMPAMILTAAQMILFAANGNLTSHASLTTGAANLILTFGNDDLKERYMRRMFTGEWQGTMALTEPQAGSSLSDITTSATPREDGGYSIKGQKIYISGGDYESASNIVHLTLARIDGGAPGTKGISLFVVPKYRLDENDELVDNHVTTAGVYGKMGQRGYVAAHLMYGEQGECVGYLVGEPHKGLRYMFQMMNEARIGTGMMAACTASAAYYASLKYANERPQGRHPSNKDPESPQVTIIEHADVRRMLLQQKAITEGSFALLLFCAKLMDISEQGPEAERKDAHYLLELLTPIAKSFPSEYGNTSVSTGMQVLGGAGYTDDFPLEQHFRDIRVNAIYEGTTTIHGMDLLGRKIPMANGKPLMLLGQRVQATIERAMANTDLKPRAMELGKTVQTLQETTMRLLQLGQTETPETFLADATTYLDYFGLVTIGWLWLEQGVVAAGALTAATAEQEINFYRGKLAAMDYFFEYELVKTRALYARLKSDRRVTLETEGAWLV